MTRTRTRRGSEPTPVRPMTAVPSPMRNASMRGASTRDAPRPADTRSVREKARAHGGIAELLVFTIGGERFGIDLAAVDEAIDLPTIHHVPEMPPAMCGVITVRGTLTSVYSTRYALGLSRADGACALIFRRGRSRLALVIDDLDDVCSVDLERLRDAPAAAAGVVLGVVRQGDALLSLVDADALLAACQASPLMEIA